jgi:hypothetical protein
MKRTIRNTTLWVILAAVGLLFIPAVIFIERRELFEALNAVCIAASVGVCVGYASSTWRAIRMPPHQMTAAHLVIVAAFLICMSLAIVFAGQYAWRAMDKPDWVIDSWPVALSRWTLAGGLVIYLATNYSRNGEIVVGAYRRTAILVALAVLIASILVWAGLG